jgi:hypothetical protein
VAAADLGGFIFYIKINIITTIKLPFSEEEAAGSLISIPIIKFAIVYFSL